MATNLLQTAPTPQALLRQARFGVLKGALLLVATGVLICLILAFGVQWPMPIILALGLALMVLGVSGVHLFEKSLASWDAQATRIFLATKNWGPEGA